MRARQPSRISAGGMLPPRLRGLEGVRADGPDGLRVARDKDTSSSGVCLSNPEDVPPCWGRLEVDQELAPREKADEEGLSEHCTPPSASGGGKGIFQSAPVDIRIWS